MLPEERRPGLTRPCPFGTVRRPRISARRSSELPLRPVLIAIALAAGLAGTARAQSTICRDGTVLTGANARALCAANGGLPPNPFTSDAAPPRASSASPSPASPAAGGGPGMVWVNAGSKSYHCPGGRYYGKTKRGEYRTEAAAKSAGAHHGGKNCF